MEVDTDLFHENHEDFIDNVHRYFMKKEQLVSAYKGEIVLPQESGRLIADGHDGNGFEATLSKLRSEMLQLMQYDVQLWNQLTKLHASISTLKANLEKETLFSESAASFSSTSSDTDTGSFVSAEEYSETVFEDNAQNRVISWIKQCESLGNVNDDNIEGTQIEGYRPRSGAYNDLLSKSREIKNFQDNLFTKCFTDVGKPLNGTEVEHCTLSFNYLQEVLNSNILNACLTKLFERAHTMKSLDETEVVSTRKFSYYKTSLRLLGSVRMRSRIFEPSLTKWRPFALCNSADNFIIVPPTAYSNIQPRPKLRRLCNVFNDFVAQSDNEIRHENEHNDGKELNLSQDKGKVQRENLAITDAITTDTKLSDTEIINVNRINLLYSGINEIEETDVGLKLSGVNAKRENSETVWKPVAQTLEEPADTEQDADSSNRECGDKINAHCDKDNTSASVSWSNSDLFCHNFLEVKDGLVTCRILSSNLENELNQAIVEQNDFEYLAIVDGRVCFKPHTKNYETEESYFLGWLFENDNLEKTEYINLEDEDSYSMHLLFNESNEREDTNKGETESEDDELGDSYNIYELFQELDETEISDIHKETWKFSDSRLETEDGFVKVHGDTSTDNIYDTATGSSELLVHETSTLD